MREIKDSPSSQFPIMTDATLLSMRGHMHDGGDRMILSVNNRTVCESLPEYKERELWSMTACADPVDVKKGDYITLTSIYDVPKHPLYVKKCARSRILLT
jgi:hypothetical protein